MWLPLRPNNPCSSDTLLLLDILPFAQNLSYYSANSVVEYSLEKVTVEKMTNLPRESTSWMHLLHLVNGAQHTLSTQRCKTSHRSLPET